MAETSSNRYHRDNGNSAGAKSTSLGYRLMRDSESKPNQGSHSKFNQILSNFERSILSQFNGNGNQNKKSYNQTPQTNDKVRQTEGVASSDMGDKSGLDRKACIRREVSEHAKKPSHSQEQSTSKAKVTTSLKSSVVKSASERLGKLTLPSKNQQNKPSREQTHHVVASSLQPNTNTITNKLPIPPPHAHSEAKSQNQTFLFGNGAMRASFDTDHLSLHDLPRASLNASASSTLRRAISTSKMASDKLLGELHANQLNSSPASLTKSLSAIVTKSGSQSNNCKISQDDEEESGFAAYHTRRALAPNSQPTTQQQKQTQSTLATGEQLSNSMMYQFANRPPYLYPVHLQNRVANQHIIDDRNGSNLLQRNMFQNANFAHDPTLLQINLRQCTQPVITQNGQPTTRGSSHDLRYPHFNQQTHLNNVAYNQQREPHFTQETKLLQQAAYLDSQNRLALNASANHQIDNGQQIYANAPPKPRRYQYYNLSRQALAPNSQPTTQQPKHTQPTLATGEQLSNSMMYQFANRSPYLYPVHQQNRVANQHIIDNRNGSNLLQRNMFQNANFAHDPTLLQINLRQCTQPVITQNSQSTTQNSPHDFRYPPFNQQINLNNVAHTKQRELHFTQDTKLFQQATYIDSQNRLAPNSPASRQIDNGQQIYANAPPKPRRYQNYNLSASSRSLSLADLTDSSAMGNRQHRQYQVQQNREVDIRNRVVNLTRLQNDANSNLIVDLTTPKVLAKTQTTLQPTPTSTTDHTDAWSINQVGLPHMSESVSTSSKSHDLDRKSFAITDLIASNQSQSNSQEKSGSNQSEISTKSSNLERTAPYYYSDLKSEEQRRALMSIVQQKSLSPPPQLLSRSTDQSTTRLTPKSATMHPSHARILSDNLAQRRRVQDGSSEVQEKGSAAEELQSRPGDSSSIPNITENIDKLFNNPFSRRDVAGTRPAQSMLTLNDDKKSRDQSHLSLDQTIKEVNADSISSGYCSSELRSKIRSKSKSLENVSQKSVGSGHAPSNRKFIHPVYENINGGSNLLNMIKNIDSNLTSGSSLAKNDSESSMDSILGSSLDDSDSSSDMIDDLKVSSTGDHLNDITDLIEQLKINHSKITEEYRSTLSRIARTINSKNKQDGLCDEKIARRLDLLQKKSMKCESRSKNQLALIQMMEKVLKQSKMKAISNKSPGPKIDDGHQNSKGPIADLESVMSEVSRQPGQTEVDKGCERATEADVSGNLLQVNSQSRAKNINPTDKAKVSPLEIIKAIVVEKETESTEFVKPNGSSNIVAGHSRIVAMLNQPDRTDNKTDLSDFDNLISQFKKTNAIANRVHHVENRLPTGEVKRKTNLFSRDSPDKGISGNPEAPRSNNQQERFDYQPNDGDKDSLRDDEDFIEFLSNDSSSHRSTFDASQFSASDFNQSTSVSESSNSSGPTRDDSLGSLMSKANNNLFKSSSNLGSAKTVGILKSSNRRSYDGSHATESNNDRVESGQLADKITSDEKSMPTRLCDVGGADEKRLMGVEKFKNVLGNVIDVDSCSVNNLSGTSPVNSHRTACLN